MARTKQIMKKRLHDTHARHQERCHSLPKLHFPNRHEEAPTVAELLVEVQWTMPTQEVIQSPTLEVPLTPGWDIVLTDDEDFAVTPTAQSVPTVVSAMTYESLKLPNRVKTPHLE